MIATSMLRRHRLGFFLSLICPFGIAAALYAAWQAPAPNASQTISKRFEDVRFGPETYHLPIDEYQMWNQAYNKKTDEAAFGLSAIAPDVLPSSSDPQEAASWSHGVGWHKLIHLLFEYGPDLVPISQEKLFQQSFDDSIEMKALQDHIAETMPIKRFTYLDIDRFTILNSSCKEYLGYSVGGNSTISCNNHRERLVLRCHPETEIRVQGRVFPRFPSCTVIFTVSAKTFLTYSYGYEFRKNALEIHQKILGLLKSFRQSPT